MLNTKYVLMLVVLSAGTLTALTGTGMSQAQTAFADKERVCEDNNNDNCNDQKQTIHQENNCKIENENENKDRSDDNTNDISTGQQEFNCWNYAQNAGRDANAQDDAFSGPSD
jgi:maltose-binding protein MalE